METIKLERWVPKEGDPVKQEYAGQRTAQEVFREMAERLDNRGCLPDEYFQIGTDWENGREIPAEADIFCTVDYGGSEGVYLDVYLKWHEDGKPIIKSFATGKTLGETGADMDRMFLIASEVTKAFHGDGGQYSRYMTLHPEQNAKNMVLSLTPAEHKLFVNALVEHRERMREQMDGTEQLLRRMTGSITEYMSVVGERPLRISDYDRTSLAIRDGELQAFKELYPKVAGRADDLLVEAAGRSGDVGRKMTLLLLSDVERFSEYAYNAATQRAVDTGDTQRVQLLMEQAASQMEEFSASYYGEVISYALKDNLAMAKVLIHDATPEQIQASPPLLFGVAARKKDFHVMLELVEKGLQPGIHAKGLLHTLTCGGRDTWIAEQLIKSGMTIQPDDYEAFQTCICNDAIGCAKLLLEHGVDFEGYLSWAAENGWTGRCHEAVEQLADHWYSLHPKQEQAQGWSGPTMEMGL